MNVCGFCGHNVADTENALCASCGEDFWVKPEDYDNADLKHYIQNAISSLDVTWHELRKIVVLNDKVLYEEKLKIPLDK